jgi:hypothetical protein
VLPSPALPRERQSSLGASAKDGRKLRVSFGGRSKKEESVQDTREVGEDVVRPIRRRSRRRTAV